MTCSLKMEGESYKHFQWQGVRAGERGQKIIASEVTKFSLHLPQICYWVKAMVATKEGYFS